MTGNFNWSLYRNMERRQHAQKSVNFEATLIGKRTVPKGCHVLNVSQQGMSLQCEPDGRLLTFNKGDSVVIYLLARNTDGHNKFSIPAVVSNVNENTVDVVFHSTNVRLAVLIDSYRASGAHELEVLIGHRKESAQVTENIPDSANDARAAIDRPDQAVKETRRTPIYKTLLLLLLAATVCLAFYVYHTELNFRFGELEKITRAHSDVLAELQPHVSSSRVQDAKYGSLDARLTDLKDAYRVMDKRIALLNSRQKGEGPAVAGSESATVQVASAEPAEPVTEEVSTTVAADTPAATMAVSNETAAIADRPESPDAEPDIQPDPVAVAEEPVSAVSEPVADKKPVTSEPEDGGPWVINLISSREKAYVTRYAARAQAKGISTEIINAEVKGREYWRLQVTGFKTMDEAKYFSEPIKEELGIKDVWIFKRK